MAFHLSGLLVPLHGIFAITEPYFSPPGMVTILSILFWASLAILFYCYIGYGILIYFLTVLKQIFSNIKEVKPVLEIIPVTLIVTAYNEEQVLEEKIKNTQAINYPSEKLKIIFITFQYYFKKNKIFLNKIHIIYIIYIRKSIFDWIYR